MEGGEGKKHPSPPPWIRQSEARRPSGTISPLAQRKGKKKGDLRSARLRKK